LLEQVRAVLGEYEDHLPLTIRQIFYRLVGAHNYEKTEQAYARLCEHLNRARRARVISMDAIRDDGGVIQEPNSWTGTEQFWRSVRRMAERFTLDHSAGQKSRLVVTCEAEDVSPPLAWEGVPNGAKSLVLIIDDPDAPDPKAPKMVWVHWVVYNMPPDTKSLPENAGKARLPPGALLGLNDFRKTGYGGPCPPIGRHRYFHKLYALDITLDLRDATKSQIERAMQGHILANAELIGTYQKGGR
jgi:Raf kinase inhibitor-like YbhB/YbcL family protein